LLGTLSGQRRGTARPRRTKRFSMGRSHVAVLAAVALFTLGACGSTEEAPKEAGGAKVATLESAPAPAASESKKPERPRERLDTTPEEYEALLGPYNKCMEEQGFGSDVAKRRAADAAVAPAGSAEDQRLTAASQLCESQFMPLPPWERDPANPEAGDFAVAVVKCLKKEGVKFVAVSDDGISIALGGDQNDSRSISLGLERMGDCERKVAKAMKD
jgi:hypothetical protein